MSQKNEIYIEKEREANVAKELRKKQCHTCQSCRKMTQMRSGLLTDPNRNPDLLPLGPLKIQVRIQIRLQLQLQLQLHVAGWLLAESCQPRKTRINSLKVASQNFVEISQLKGHTTEKKPKNKPNKKP